MLITILLVLFSAPLIAQDGKSLDWTTTKDKWGQLILCQRIYKMPEVKTRLYDFDIEQCDKAGQLVIDVISKYSEQQKAQLKNQAERHAFMLSQNTSCREYCSKLAEIQDKRSD